ncbi:MAG: response regulator [Bacteroidetes bacterium]|nr:response regulator [Bacteroidota bacterium]
MSLFTVIIVDDEMLFCNSLVAALSDAGYVARGFHTPETALNYLKRHTCDLLITDFRMPEMDGLKLIARAREIRSDMRAFLISAHLTQNIHDRARLLNVDMLLEKPIELSELIADVAGLQPSLLTEAHDT